MGGGLRAGFARRDITPPGSFFLAGYPHAPRMSEGVHDPLFASALALESGGMGAIFVSLDLLFVTAEWTAEWRRRAGKATGLPGDCLLAAATHTHSGPLTAEILAWRGDPVVPKPDPAVIELTLSGAAEAAIAAWEARTEAVATWACADVRGIAGGNRLLPGGPEDPAADLLVLRHEPGHAPLGVLAIYGMHPTVLHEDTRLATSDFIAFARREIEAAMPGAGVVYLNGVCGDQSPRRVVREQTFAEARRIGSALGRAMAAATTGARGLDRGFELAAASGKVSIEGRRFPPVAEAAARLAAARARFEQLKAGGAPKAEVRTAECAVFGAEEVLTMARAEETGEAEAARCRYREAEVQVFRLGERLLAAGPGEFFV
ncbi:MAG: hypothetical protein N2322_00250, partial [Terrimicrobiaceae bacterium]|nr:hypothetical protein [Terrimicrobiaceae bacterium]